MHYAHQQSGVKQKYYLNKIVSFIFVLQGVLFAFNQTE